MSFVAGFLLGLIVRSLLPADEPEEETRPAARWERSSRCEERIHYEPPL